MWRTSLRLALVGLAACLATPHVLAAETASPETPNGPELVWHHDYAQAQRLARLQRKLLLVYFQADPNNPVRQGFESMTLSDPEVRGKLQSMVLARLPLDATIVVDGKSTLLLSHPAFREMLGRQGIAIVDYAHENPKTYGQVVSAFPFPRGRYYASRAMRVILDLPEGTLTQRTMIYAVRIHPEAPAGASGILNQVLAEEAESHSRYQARIRNQGHHAWESRFHRINSRLGTGDLSQEVVAESWAGQSLVEAAVECVHSWRQSPGHWGAVRARNRGFGFDIKRGSNGIWYATGIFARR